MISCTSFVNFLSKSGVSERITTLQSKVDDLKTKISSEKSALKDVETQEFTPENKKMISDITDKTVQLRKELNQAREELNKYLFAIYANPAKKPDYKSLSLEGTPVVGETLSRVAVTERLDGSYNYIFEICSGDEMVRVPVVYVKSDTEEVSVRLSDRILPNSCQLSTVKITANDINSITVTPDSNKEVSVKISEVEKLLAEKAQELEAEKKNLNELLFKAPKPADYEQKVTEISNKIVSIRNEMNEARALLHGYLSLV